MKKYFVTSIFTATVLSISLLSCKKELPVINNTNKANTGNVSMIKPHPIVTQDDSVIVKR